MARSAVKKSSRTPKKPAKRATLKAVTRSDPQTPVDEIVRLMDRDPVIPESLRKATPAELQAQAVSGGDVGMSGRLANVCMVCLRPMHGHGPACEPQTWWRSSDDVRLASRTAELAEPTSPISAHRIDKALAPYDSRFGVGVLLGVCIGIPVGVIALRLFA